MSLFEGVLHDWNTFGPGWAARERVIDGLLWLLLKVETHKDRCLARRLHNIADEYDPRPTGAWGGVEHGLLGDLVLPTGAAGAERAMVGGGPIQQTLYRLERPLDRPGRPGGDNQVECCPACTPEMDIIEWAGSYRMGSRLFCNCGAQASIPNTMHVEVVLDTTRWRP